MLYTGYQVYPGLGCLFFLADDAGLTIWLGRCFIHKNRQWTSLHFSVKSHEGTSRQKSKRVCIRTHIHMMLGIWIKPENVTRTWECDQDLGNVTRTWECDQDLGMWLVPRHVTGNLGPVPGFMTTKLFRVANQQMFHGWKQSEQNTINAEIVACKNLAIQCKTAYTKISANFLFGSWDRPILNT